MKHMVPSDEICTTFSNLAAELFRMNDVPSDFMKYSVETACSRCITDGLRGVLTFFSLA